MGFIQRIVDSINKNRPEILALPDALSFSAINREAIEQQTRLLAKAEERGKRNQPDSSAISFDAVELEIEEKVMGVVRPYQELHEENLKSYSARLASLDPFGLAAGIRGEATNNKAHIQMTISRANSEMYLARESLESREKDYQKFKKNHGSPPDPHFWLSTKTKYALLAVFVIGEATLNSFMIGPYLGGGILEGFGIAVIFPLLTIVMCGLPMGIYLRRLTSPFRQDRSGIKKEVSIVALTFSVAFLVNLLLAYIRVAVTPDDGEWTHALGMWLGIFTWDLPPLDLPSFLLLLISTSFFILAGIDVMKLDHPIPGYFAMYSLRMSAHQEYKQKMRCLHDELSQLRKITDKFTAVYDLLRTWQVEYNQILSSKQKLNMKYMAYIDHVEQVMNALLRRYRDRNEEFRETKPPKYFNVTWKFPAVNRAGSGEQNRSNEFSRGLEVAIEAIQEVQRDINVEMAKVPHVVDDVSVVLENRGGT